jgi:hypothetical protein
LQRTFSFLFIFSPKKIPPQVLPECVRLLAEEIYRVRCGDNSGMVRIKKVFKKVKKNEIYRVRCGDNSGIEHIKIKIN